MGKKQYRCFEIIAQRFQQKHVNYNLVFFPRRDRYFYNLIVRDEIEICTFYISCFEKGTRNKKGFLVIEREFSLLILTRFFEIENSRQFLPPTLTAKIPCFSRDE